MSQEEPGLKLTDLAVKDARVAYKDQLIRLHTRLPTRDHPFPPLHRETSVEYLDAFILQAQKRVFIDPMDKVARWLGWIQGSMGARGYTSVSIEREATRGVFELVRDEPPSYPDEVIYMATKAMLIVRTGDAKSEPTKAELEIGRIWAEALAAATKPSSTMLELARRLRERFVR